MAEPNQSAEKEALLKDIPAAEDLQRLLSACIYAALNMIDHTQNYRTTTEQSRRDYALQEVKTYNSVFKNAYDQFQTQVRDLLTMHGR